MAQRLSLGNKCYVFEDDSKNPGNELIVSAHGGYWVGLSGTFRVPDWTILHFMSPHKTTLSDPTVRRVMGGIPVYESFGPGDVVRNYQLSKYQGRHNDMGETYASIEDDIESNRRTAQLAAEQPGPELEKLRARGVKFESIDVLTVRNRKLRIPPTLSEVINELDKDIRRYPNIYCVICRSPIGLSSQGYKV